MENVTIEKTGRYTSVWNRKTTSVDLMAEGVATPIANWAYEPELREVENLIANENGKAGPLTAEEIMFILFTATTVDCHTEYAESDLYRHGAIGVTY